MSLTGKGDSCVGNVISLYGGRGELRGQMIKLVLEKGKIELEDYSEDATLQELSDEVEAFRVTNKLKTRYCKGCGECCNQPIPVIGMDIIRIQRMTGLKVDDIIKKHVTLQQKPDINARKSAIGDFMRMGEISFSEAAVLYEYNQCEPLILPRKKDGTCIFLDNESGLCTIYGQVYRPYTCNLYICTMGDELSAIQEMIVRQGTWHAYSLLGWVSTEEISHNPFLDAGDYDKVYVKDFSFNSGKALEQLFFYF